VFTLNILDSMSIGINTLESQMRCGENKFVWMHNNNYH